MLTIAIIGAGFSGTMTAVHLLRQRETPVHIQLFNKKKELYNRNSL